LAGRRPGAAVAVAVAVAVAGVAAPAWAAVGVAPDVGVDDHEGADDVGVVSPEEPQVMPTVSAGRRVEGNWRETGASNPA
jgi:hypothetical protein